MFLSALGATEGAKNSFDFATKIGIRIAGLKEVRKLRRLIVHAVNRLDDGSCSLDQKVSFREKSILKVKYSFFSYQNQLRSKFDY